MNSPPSSAEKAPLYHKLSDQHFATYLTRGLEEVVKERDEATPEPKFGSDEFEENH